MIWATTMLETELEADSCPLEVAGGEPWDREGEARDNLDAAEGAPADPTELMLVEVAVRERDARPGGTLP